MAGSAAVYTKKVLFLSFSKTRLDYIKENQAPHASRSLLCAFFFQPTMVQIASSICPPLSCFVQHAQEGTVGHQPAHFTGSKWTRTSKSGRGRINHRLARNTLRQQRKPKVSKSRPNEALDGQKLPMYLPLATLLVSAAVCPSIGLCLVVVDIDCFQCCFTRWFASFWGQFASENLPYGRFKNQ